MQFNRTLVATAEQTLQAGGTPEDALAALAPMAQALPPDVQELIRTEVAEQLESKVDELLSHVIAGAPLRHRHNLPVTRTVGAQRNQSR